MAAIIGPLLIILGALAASVSVLIPLIVAFGAPVLAITAALVGLGAAAYQVYKHWEPLEELFTSIWKKIPGILKVVPRFMARRLGFGDVGAAVKGQQNVTVNGERSQTDVNIRLAADYGTSAIIEAVKEKAGAANVKTFMESYVGAGAF